MVAQIKSGELLVRPLTKQDIGAIEEAIKDPNFDSGRDTHSTDWSDDPQDREASRVIAAVEEFADHLTSLLETFTKPAKAT